MLTRWIVLFVTLSLPVAALAQSFFLRELIVIPVRPIDQNTFEAFETSGVGGSQMWCAAGKFTRDYLRQRGGDITVLRARGTSETYPGRKSVIFTTRPVENAVTLTSEGVRTPGQRFSMTHANALCRSQPELLIRVRVIDGSS
ncbi:MAG: hypothetical protein AAFP16_14310 [Pseudomonadota bacterium]